MSIRIIFRSFSFGEGRGGFFTVTFIENGELGFNKSIGGVGVAFRRSCSSHLSILWKRKKNPTVYHLWTSQTWTMRQSSYRLVIHGCRRQSWAEGRCEGLFVRRRRTKSCPAVLMCAHSFFLMSISSLTILLNISFSLCPWKGKLPQSLQIESKSKPQSLCRNRLPNRQNPKQGTHNHQRC